MHMLSRQCHSDNECIKRNLEIKIKEIKWWNDRNICAVKGMFCDNKTLKDFTIIYILQNIESAFFAYIHEIWKWKVW